MLRGKSFSFLGGSNADFGALHDLDLDAKDSVEFDVAIATSMKSILG
jgi:hypothetical protein